MKKTFRFLMDFDSGDNTFYAGCLGLVGVFVYAENRKDLKKEAKLAIYEFYDGKIPMKDIKIDLIQPY